MRIQFIICMQLLFVCTVAAQTIMVKDKVSDQPVENVIIYSLKHSVFTDKNGMADVSKFNETDTLVFQHPSYKSYSLIYSNLSTQGFKVLLTENFLEIDQLVISANRWEQNKREVPNKIVVIPAKEVIFYNPQTTADLLGNSNEVFIQKSQLGGGSPMIRGFSTNRVLIVVDGVRMNNPIYRSGNLQNVISLDANAIQSTEVIFGPGSVIYGSDAIGGLMDFHTLQAKLSSTGNASFAVNANTRYSSADQEKTSHVDFNLELKKWSFLSSITYTDFNDLHMGSKRHNDYTRPEYVERVNGKDSILVNNDKNVQKFSGYNQFNLLQKVKFVPNDQWNFQYSFHYSRLSDVPRYDRLIEYKGSTLKYAEWYYGPQIWMMNSLTVKYMQHSRLFDEVKLIFAHQNYEESRHDRKMSNDTTIYERADKVGILSLNVDFDKSLEKDKTLFYGLEAVTNKVSSTGIERYIQTGEKSPLDSRYPDGSTYLTYAGYINYKQKFTDKFFFLAGARYSQVILNAEFDTTFFPFPFKEIKMNTGSLTGSLGLVYHPTETWQLNLNTSTGFRSPNIDDAGRVFDSEPGSVVVPNDELKSEYAYNVELGIIKTISDRVKLELTGFYTYLDDAIVRRDFLFNGEDTIVYSGELSKVEALVNADHAFVYGGHFLLYADILPILAFKTNITYSKGEEEGGVPLRHAGPVFGSTHCIVKIKKFKGDVYVNYNGEISNKNLTPSEQSKPHMYAKDSDGNPYCPAWFTLNIKTGYQLNRVIHFGVGVENILDVRYRPYSSGIVAPGRNFIFALRGNF